MFAVVTLSTDPGRVRAASWSEEAIRNGLSPLDRVGDEMLAFTAVRFSTGTAPDGAAWAPLRPSTLRYKVGAPLVKTGALKSSFAKRTDRAANKVRVASPLFYGRFLNDGTKSMSARSITPETMPSALRERIRIVTREAMLQAIDKRNADAAATGGTR